MSRDHMLGFVQGAPDPLARALDDDAFGRQVGRMVRGLSAAEQAVQDFEIDDHLPDGTIKPRVLFDIQPPPAEPRPLSLAEQRAAWDMHNTKLIADRKAYDAARDADNARRAEAFKAAQAARLSPELADQIAGALRQSPGYLNWAAPPQCECPDCVKARAQVVAVAAGVPVAQLMREYEVAQPAPANPGGYDLPADAARYVTLRNDAVLMARPQQVRAG